MEQRCHLQCTRKHCRSSQGSRRGSCGGEEGSPGAGAGLEGQWPGLHIAPPSLLYSAWLEPTNPAKQIAANAFFGDSQGCWDSTPCPVSTYPGKTMSKITSKRICKEPDDQGDFITNKYSISGSQTWIQISHWGGRARNTDWGKAHLMGDFHPVPCIRISGSLPVLHMVTDYVHIKFHDVYNFLWNNMGVGHGGNNDGSDWITVGSG